MIIILTFSITFTLASLKSLFAYRNVTQILNYMKRTHTLMGEQLTEFINEFDKNDPEKYDFAICYIAIHKLGF